MDILLDLSISSSWLSCSDSLIIVIRYGSVIAFAFKS